MHDGRVKVVFIAGEYRSGSTIIGNTLGQIPGFFFTSELRNIWEKGIIDNVLCGCGSAFSDCETWQSILARAFNEPHQALASEMLTARRSGFRSRHIPMAVMGKSKKPTALNGMGRYTSNLEKLYNAIQAVTGCRVIVDSSNTASHAYLLSTMPSIDLRVLHLVRDARGVAFSWRRKKRRLDTDEYMMQRTPSKSALMWMATNSFCQILSRDRTLNWMQVKYEDFAANPKQMMLSILSFVGEKRPPSELPFPTERSVFLKPTHGIWGNPNRHKAGQIDIRVDDEWQKKMPVRDKLLVSALAAPLLLKYGYFRS